jgi:hypothetical protein
MGDESDEAVEAVSREIMTAAEEELGRPLYTPPAVLRDPDFYEVGEGLAQWWRARLSMPPTLILKCGIDGCKSIVGEVKTDNDVAILLLHMRFGKREVPVSPPVTEEGLGFSPGTVLRDVATGETLAETQLRRADELAAETLDWIGDDRRVAKRYTATSILIQLEHFVQLGDIYGCPKHGRRAVRDPEATVAGIREFLATPTAKHASKRTYVIFRGN